MGDERLRALAPFVLAGSMALGAMTAAQPARSQCYPGLACPTDQQPQQPSPGSQAPLPGPSDAGSQSRQKSVEYHYVGPVRPPDDWLALRSLPTSKGGERIMKMPAGTLFKVGEKRGEWWFVTLQDGTSGWAHSNWIRCCKYGNE